jgi:hypothetical protein
MIKRISNRLLAVNDAYLFYAVLIVDLVLAVTTKYCPSVDGPAHLYNSTILVNFINNEVPVVNNFYEPGNFFIPNWSGHFILAAMNALFPAWMAEKIVLMLYMAGLALSFRYLLKQLSPANLWLSVLVFPFSYSFLFYMGFYNTCISFAFMFFAQGYWLKFKDKLGLREMITLTALFLLTYYSNVLSFLFLGFSLGTFSFFSFFMKIIKAENFKKSLTDLVRKIVAIAFISLPGLLLLYLFNNSIQFPQSDTTIPAKELLDWLWDVRPLIGYDYTQDEVYSRKILYLMLAIIVLNFYLRVKQKRADKTKDLIMIQDVFLALSFISVALLFLIPDGANAGMMSIRYCLLAYMFFIVWVASLSVPTGVSIIGAFLILFLHFNLRSNHFETIRVMNDRAVKINIASNYVKKGALVLPVNLSDSWLEIHFSNYLGIDKPMVILENYEATVGWFPVKWKENQVPEILVGDNEYFQARIETKGKSRQVTYILLYGNIEKMEEAEYNQLVKVLQKRYIKKYSSDDKYVTLYELSKGGKL